MDSQEDVTSQKTHDALDCGRLGIDCRAICRFSWVVDSTACATDANTRGVPCFDWLHRVNHASNYEVLRCLVTYKVDAKIKSMTINCINKRYLSMPWWIPKTGLLQIVCAIDECASGCVLPWNTYSSVTELYAPIANERDKLQRLTLCPAMGVAVSANVDWWVREYGLDGVCIDTMYISNMGIKGDLFTAVWLNCG